MTLRNEQLAKESQAHGSSAEKINDKRSLENGSALIAEALRDASPELQVTSLLSMQKP